MRTRARRVRKTGKVTVSKSVVSDVPADKTATYTFTILLNEKISGTFNGVPFENGKATLTITGSGSKEITGLPTGVTYTVVEAAVAGMDTTSTGETGTITADGTTAAFTNTRKTTELDVKKTVVSSNDADKEKDFTFKVTLKDGDTPITGTFSGVEFNASGEGTFTLKHDQTKKIEGLPAGVS